VLAAWKSEFDQLYRESEKGPTLFHITFHPFVSGRAARAKAMKEFLRQVTADARLWLARSIKVPEWRLKQRY
jgi:hypothetical protein